MNKDIRVRTCLPSDLKLKKLRRKLGSEGVDALFMLWCWAGEHRWEGILRDMDPEEIEEQAGWGTLIKGEPGKLVEALVTLRWLDPPGKTDLNWFALHDWEDWQGYAVNAAQRSRDGKKGATVRWDKERKKGAPDAEGIATAVAPASAPPNAPVLTSPVQTGPSPVQTEEEEKAPPAPPCAPGTETIIEPGTALAVVPQADIIPIGEAGGRHQFKHILDAWNLLAARKGFRTCRRANSSRLKHLNARVADTGWEWQRAIQWMAKHIPDIVKVEAGEATRHFLQGDSERQWKATFDWFVTQGAVDKILEGNFEPETRSGKGKRGGRGKEPVPQAVKRIAQRGADWAAQGGDET